MGRGCDPRGRPYTTFRDAILAMGSTLNNDHTKKRFFVLFFRSAKYRSAVRHKSAGKMR